MTSKCNCIACINKRKRILSGPPKPWRGAPKTPAVASPFLKVHRPVRIVVKERPWGTHCRIRAYPIQPRDQLQFVSDLALRGKSVLNAIGVEYATTAVSPGNPG